MAVIKIGGVTLPTPTVYNFDLSDMDGDKAGRDLDYIMQRDRKRSNVYKLKLGWENIALPEIRLINNAIAPEKVSVYFFDVLSGTYKTKTMYAGDKKITTLIIKGDMSEAIGSISFNLIEI